MDFEERKKTFLKTREGKYPLFNAPSKIFSAQGKVAFNALFHKSSKETERETEWEKERELSSLSFFSFFSILSNFKKVE